MTTLQTAIQQDLPELKFEFDKPLRERTYFKIGGPAEVWLETADSQQLCQAVAWCHAHDCPVTLLGGASNTIVNDQGLVLHLPATPVDTSRANEGLVVVGAGTLTPLAVRESVTAGLTGLEYFMGVPGTIGGAVYNNAHYLTHLIGQYVKNVTVITKKGELKTLPQAECDFAYDHSRFHSSGEIIFSVEFELAKGDAATSQTLIKEATLYRAKTQPLGEPSSGCIFRNAPNTPELQKLFPQFAERSHVPGGFLIDQAGLKGAKEGDIEVSQIHAAFFVNKGQGTTQDVKKLIARVKTTVRERFGVELQEEVFYLG
jgi:UDP-N-acetylmuramate dehydrogenase